MILLGGGTVRVVFLGGVARVEFGWTARRKAWMVGQGVKVIYRWICIVVRSLREWDSEGG